MIRIVDWAVNHWRMVIACVALAITSGVTAYVTLPKDGAPDIEIPSFFISVPFPGISPEDAERLIVLPLEARLAQVDGLKEMYSTAAEGYAGIALNFEFGLDKAEMLADIRDLVSRAQAEFPEGAEEPTVNEFSFSDFPIIVVVLSGDVQERVLLDIGEDIKDRLESLPSILEVGFTGRRAQMVEVIIKPLQLDAYDISADELISVFTRNNRLIPAGEVETEQGAFAVRIPSAFDNLTNIESLPIKVVGDRVVKLGDIAEVRMTFEDRSGFARHNAEPTVAMQVVKRLGENVIDTAALVRQTVQEERNSWPMALQNAVRIDFAQDQSTNVKDMVTQLESSVLTAVALVMIVVLATLGSRSSLLVGFAIPSSFVICFMLLAIMGVSISNIVMFGLILAVGMLVDSAIVIVELADRRIKEGSPPFDAFAHASKRMFWPIVSSTATTLCAFLPMLFWPGFAGQFMATLPVTIIFVLSASLVVALIFLPVVGGVAGQISNSLSRISEGLARTHILVRLLLLLCVLAMLLFAAAVMLNPSRIFSGTSSTASTYAALPGVILFAVNAFFLSIVTGSIRIPKRRRKLMGSGKRSLFGYIMQFVVGNPIMPIVCVVAAFIAVVGVFRYYGDNNYGVEFFVDTEPEQLQVFVRARGNLSLAEKDSLVKIVENAIVGTEGISSVFAFTGAGGLQEAEGGSKPVDTIGVIQIEFDRWEDRQKAGGISADSRNIQALIEDRLKNIPGIQADVQESSNGGPSQGKPIHLRFTGANWDELLDAVSHTRSYMDKLPALTFVEDTSPLPGIDWKIDIDMQEAGRYQTDVTTIGAMIQMVTRGIRVGSIRVPTYDGEIDVRARFPEEDRHLSTLDSLRVRTPNGLVPLSNFVLRVPVPKVGEISRFDQTRYIDIKADLQFGLTNSEGKPITPNERIAVISDWLENDADLPNSVSWQWTGDQAEQAESEKFLIQAFLGALGLMFAVLLAQFNSFYNAVLVLLAVVISSVGVLLGLIIMQQPFSIIMSGVGVVALAGIVVNNNIVLIDTYQEYSKTMPKIEAIIRTAELRIRPVMLTSITTITGLMPMVFGFAINVVDGGYTVDTPAALWWKQLASAVVFGLGTATLLTLVITPSLLAIPIWAKKGAYRAVRGIAAVATGKNSRVSRDLNLYKSLRKNSNPTLLWEAVPEITQIRALEDQRPENACD